MSLVIGYLEGLDQGRFEGVRACYRNGPMTFAKLVTIQRVMRSHNWKPPDKIDLSRSEAKELWKELSFGTGKRGGVGALVGSRLAGFAIDVPEYGKRRKL